MLNKREKIAFFLPSLDGGGAERVFLNFANKLSEKGFQVDIVLSRVEGSYLDQVSSNVSIIDLNSKRVLYSLPSLTAYLFKEKPHVLLSAMEHVNIIALISKIFSFSSTKVVVTIHNTLSKTQEDTNLFKTKLIPFFIKIFYRFAYKIIAVSKGVADDFSKYTKIPRSRIKVIYNPVITPELYIKSNEKLDHPWFNDKTKPIIISAGRLVNQKNYSLLIKAFSIVKENIDSRLIILGEGEERKMLESVISDLSLENYVSLPGFVNNPYKYIKNSSVFVLSSLYEGLPTVLIEAMALGVPVVSTDCPSGPNEILDGGRLGYLVPVNNHLLLAQAIISCLKNPLIPSKDDLNKYEINFSLDQYIKECNFI